jgi:hypothetical protein
MTALLCVLLCVTGTTPVASMGSGLELIGPSCGECQRQGRMPYVPQPGDLVLFHHHSYAVNALYYLGFCGGTTHSGIVVAHPRGGVVMLEAPFLEPVTFVDLASRVAAYKGRVEIRRRKIPLTEQQSARLTAFACAQLGKPFHLPGMLLPTVTWPLDLFQDHCVSDKELNPPNWICSELVIAATIAAGLVTPCGVKPACVCADDLRTDRILDLSCGWWPPLTVIRVK